MAESSSSSWYNDHNREWMVDVCAGWISGAVTIVTLQPLDTILTRWQANGILPIPLPLTTPAATATAAAAATAPLSSIPVPKPTSSTITSIATQRAASMYTSTIVPLPTTVYANTANPSHNAAISNHWRIQTQQLVSSHGWRALWRGAGPMLAVVPLQNGLLMAGYGYGARWIETPTSHTGTTGCTTSDNTQRQTQLTAIFVGGCTGGTKRESVTIAV
jgi:Mitochondrial carrier protein